MDEQIQNKIEEIYQKSRQTAERINQINDAIKSVHPDNSTDINTLYSSRLLKETVDKIKDLLLDVNIRFVKEVESLIAKRYNMKFEPFTFTPRHKKLLCIDPVISPKIIIANIKNQCGNFLDSGLRNTLNRIWYIIKNSEHKGNRVNMSRIYFDDFSTKHYQKNRIASPEDLYDVFRLISYFELGDFDKVTPEMFAITLHNVYTQEKYLPNINLTNISAVQFYKNGKLSIYFHNSEKAAEFMAFLNSSPNV
jgi:hypothetical protein